MEKYVDDFKQDEKHVLDLVESIMRPPGFVKAELRPILFKVMQFVSSLQNHKKKTKKNRLAQFSLWLALSLQRQRA